MSRLVIFVSVILSSFSNSFGNIASLPVCIDCGNICPTVNKGYGYWCSSPNAVMKDWGEDTDFETSTAGARTYWRSLSSMNLDKCLSTNYSLVRLPHGFCCTWSENNGCQAIGLLARERVLPYPCDMCTTKCPCSAPRSRDLMIWLLISSGLAVLSHVY